MKHILAAVLVLVFALGAYLAVAKSFTPQKPSGAVCTMEAKQCPDGSYVGRTGPKCEFAACPGQDPSNKTKVSITSITPSSAAIGTKVTLKGLGFDSANMVLFGSGAVQPIPSSDGNMLTFTIPQYLNPVCHYSTPACAAPSFKLNPGVYNVSVQNTNGTSNTVTCTVTSALTQSMTSIVGTVLLGPTCPVMRNPPDPQCADKPYQTSLDVTTPDGSQVIKTFSSDAGGKFSVQVPPGTYTIRSAPSANIHPLCSTNGTVNVSAKAYASTTVYCDTGIR